MAIFKTKIFARFARRQRIDDASLIEAIQRAERGLIDADLGGGLISSASRDQAKDAAADTGR